MADPGTAAAASAANPVAAGAMGIRLCFNCR